MIGNNYSAIAVSSRVGLGCPLSAKEEGRDIGRRRTKPPQQFKADPLLAAAPECATANAHLAACGLIGMLVTALERRDGWATWLRSIKRRLGVKGEGLSGRGIRQVISARETTRPRSFPKRIEHGLDRTLTALAASTEIGE